MPKPVTSSWTLLASRQNRRRKMMTPTALLYAAAGAPPVALAEPATGACWLCASPLTDGVPLRSVLKDTFMDRDKARNPAGSHFCLACAWSFSEQVPMAGRDKPQRLRNYSHIVQRGVWHCLSKGQKANMRGLLLDPPPDEWLGVIAESGQKHVIFRAPIAIGRDRCAIQFEEQRVTYAPSALAALLTPVEALLSGGMSKTEIESGHYLTYRIARLGMDAWWPIEQIIKPHRGTALLHLAVFMAQKEEDESGSAKGHESGSAKGHEDDERDADASAGRRRPGTHPPSVDGLGHLGQEEVEVLGDIRERRDQRGQDDQQPDALAQLRLFEDGHRRAGSERG